MTQNATWVEIATLYEQLLDSDIDTDKAIAKEPQKLSFQPKHDFRVKYEIRKVIINGKVHEVRNGFVNYN